MIVLDVWKVYRRILEAENVTCFPLRVVTILCRLRNTRLLTF